MNIVVTRKELQSTEAHLFVLGPTSSNVDRGLIHEARNHTCTYRVTIIPLLMGCTDDVPGGGYGKMMGKSVGVFGNQKSVRR